MMSTGKWIVYVFWGAGLWGQTVTAQVLEVMPERDVVKESISFDRLYPPHALDEIQRTSAVLWHEVEALRGGAACSSELCEQIRHSLFQLHHAVVLQRSKIVADERAYVAAIMQKLELTSQQAHEKNPACCFEHIAWTLAGIRAEL